MPLYDFENEFTGEVREVFFHMNEKKEYDGEEGTENGCWRRKFHVPLAAIDTQIDPNNKNEFIRRGAKYSTYGAAQDKAKELSEIRAQKDGIDLVKRDYFSKYASERNGKPHPKSLPTKIETDRVVVDLS